MCVSSLTCALARNETPSPDGAWVAFTGEDNNLYVKENKTMKQTVEIDVIAQWYAVDLYSLFHCLF